MCRPMSLGTGRSSTILSGMLLAVFHYFAEGWQDKLAHRDVRIHDQAVLGLVDGFAEQRELGVELEVGQATWSSTKDLGATDAAVAVWYRLRSAGSFLFCISLGKVRPSRQSGKRAAVGPHRFPIGPTRY
jgi:hypothetical protein